MQKSGEMEEEASAEIWDPLATTTKSWRELGRKIYSEAPKAPDRQMAIRWRGGNSTQ